MAEIDVIFKGGTVVTPRGEEILDIAVRGGRIEALGSFPEASAQRVVPCWGLHILPGVIDTQVHFRDPGFPHKETLVSGSRAAVAGGVVGVFEMPNTSPATTSEAALNDKLHRAEGAMHCHYAFYMGGTRENASDLGELERLPGCAGVKVFLGSSTGSLLVEEEEVLDQILSTISRRSAYHSEDEARLRARKGERRANDPSSHPIWRDEEVALRSTRRLLGAARKHGKNIHVLHISTAEEMALLAQYRDVASVEVTPHHLLLAAEEAYERLGTLVQMNPPVRTQRHQDALWEAVGSGIVDVLGSDHAPHTLEEKAQSYPNSPSGMPGVQTLLPMMLNAVHGGKLSLARLVSLTSTRPAALFGLEGRGQIAPSYHADFSIVDLKKAKTIENAWIESVCGWTPYDGVRVVGWPVGTVVGGHLAMWEGEISKAPKGQMYTFLNA